MAESIMKSKKTGTAASAILAFVCSSNALSGIRNIAVILAITHYALRIFHPLTPERN